MTTIKLVYCRTIVFDWLIRNRILNFFSGKIIFQLFHRLLFFHALQSNPVRALWLYAKRKKFSAKRLHNAPKKCHVRWPAFLIYEPLKLLKKSSKPRYTLSLSHTHVHCLRRTHFVYILYMLFWHQPRRFFRNVDVLILVWISIGLVWFLAFVLIFFGIHTTAWGFEFLFIYLYRFGFRTDDHFVHTYILESLIA